MAEQQRDKTLPNCARCTFSRNERACTVEKGKGPPDCPTLRHAKLARELYETMPEEEMRFACMAAAQEQAGYPDRKAAAVKPRIVEIVEFAKRMDYKRLGLIFCGGSHKEAGIVQNILETNGFEVASVMCKAGRLPKSDFYPGDSNPPSGIACNPKFQAQITNMADVDFAILVNLCVGHDSLAMKYVSAPVTVLSAKDRVTGHNPLAAIYLYDTYYKFLKNDLPI